MLDLNNFFEDMMDELTSINEQIKEKEQEKSCSCENGQKCTCGVDKNKKSEYCKETTTQTEQKKSTSNMPSIFCLSFASGNDETEEYDDECQWFYSKEKAIEQMRQEFMEKIIDEVWDNSVLITKKFDDEPFEEDFTEYAILMNQTKFYSWQIIEEEIK